MKPSIGIGVGVDKVRLGSLLNPGNLMKYSENISSSWFTVLYSSKDATIYEVIDNKKIERYFGDSFYSSLRTEFRNVSNYDFEIGAKYLLSFYVKSNTSRFIWMRGISNTSSNGQGAKYIDSSFRRVFTIKTATSTRLLDAADPCWFFNCYGGYTSTANQSFDLLVGGFQIYKLKTWSKQGVALIGDSTMAGSSGKYDSVTSMEVSRWAEGLLMNDWYNRAVGGETTASMIARWSTDITTLKDLCKYCFIQGGINDINTGVSEVDLKTNIQTMYDLAIADDMQPVVATITPNSSFDATKNTIRNNVNEWIKSTFSKVADIDFVLRDPNNINALNPLWVGDGVHYSQLGKKTAGVYIAGLSFWNLIKPSKYVKTDGAIILPK